MDCAAESKALAEVQARLEKRFLNLHPELVSAAVRLTHSELDGPVRDFVPVLVEHAARNRLSFADDEAAAHRASTPHRETLNPAGGEGRAR